jgi:hypothetical protein
VSAGTDLVNGFPVYSAGRTALLPSTSSSSFFDAGESGKMIEYLRTCFPFCLSFLFFLDSGVSLLFFSAVFERTALSEFGVLCCVVCS